MSQLARLHDAGVELLAVTVSVRGGVRVEKALAVACEGGRSLNAVAVDQRLGVDQALALKLAEAPSLAAIEIVG
jgi:hypothetical protein